MNTHRVSTVLLGTLLPAGLFGACSGSALPEIARTAPRGSVRLETGVRYERGRNVQGNGLLRAIDCRDATLGVLQDDGLFLLDAEDLTVETRIRVEPCRDLALAADQVFLLTDNGDLRLLRPSAENLGESAAWPLPGATCLAAGKRLLAAGFEDGAITLLRPPSVSSDRLERAGELDLGTSGISALSFGLGAASRYLYASLQGDAQLIVIDLENPAGPAICNRIDAEESRSLSASGLDLLLTPADDAQAGPLVYDLLEPALPRLDAQFPFHGVSAVERRAARLFVLGGDQVLSTYMRRPEKSPETP